MRAVEEMEYFVSSQDNQKVRALIEGCKKSDRDSMKMLYEHFYGYAMSVCLRYAVNEDEAIEILNDGFMKVFGKINKYTASLSFPGWIRKIMVNTAIDYFRKHKKHFHHKGLDDIADTAAGSGNQESAVSKMTYDELIALVQRLPPSYRTVFNLYAIDGYNHREIAELLKISTGASKSNLSKARERLKELIKNVHHIEYAKYTG